MSVYKKTKVAGRSYSVHRLTWERANGPIPAGHVVHHINHDKLDNRIENLALMTYADHAAHHNNKHDRTKTCVVCETEFEPHATKRQRQQTCSRECMALLISEQRNAMYGVHMILCERCGIEFRVPRCRASVARFCSRSCANQRKRAA